MRLSRGYVQRKKMLSLIHTVRFITRHPLNKDRKVRSLLGFLKWQLGSRLVPGEVVFHWINDAKLIVRPGETGSTGNIYCGLHEFSDMAYVLHALDEDDLFVDVGANVGSYTILACAAKRARGYCFEPVPSTFSRLLDNIHLNNLHGRVKGLNVGVSDKVGELNFTSGLDAINHVAAGEWDGDIITTPVMTLDTLLENESPHLIKIDVEGYETAVLQGARKTLEKESLHSVIIELNGSGSRYGFDEDLILNMMDGFGFKAYSYNPFQRALIRLDGKNKNSGNTLFVRKQDWVATRLEKHRKISWHGVEF